MSAVEASEPVIVRVRQGRKTMDIELTSRAQALDLMDAIARAAGRLPEDEAPAAEPAPQAGPRDDKPGPAAGSEAHRCAACGTQYTTAGPDEVRCPVCGAPPGGAPLRAVGAAPPPAPARRRRPAAARKAAA